MLIKNDTYLFIKQEFNSFDFQDLMVFGKDDKLIGDYKCDYKCAYTFGDYKNGTYSEYKDVSFAAPINFNVPVHVSLYFPKPNVEFELKSIFYNNKQINFDDIRFETVYPTYSKHPLFDIYATNNQPFIDNWLRQCVAVTQMYGVEVIYFKTDPTQTIETLASNFMREVVATKRIKIMLSNDGLPQDQHQFTEWDILLPSDFTINIVKDIFYNAFGEKVVPNEKDIIFFPIIGKLFRVMTIQNVNKTFGRSAWWEAYLQKFEVDTSVDMDSFKDIILESPQLGDIDISLDSYIEATLNSVNSIDSDTIDEKNKATERMNVLKDTTHLISLKETELLREFYHKRLTILSLRVHEQSTRLFSVYNLTEIEGIGLTYNTENYITKNKHLNIISTSFEFAFDFVLKASTIPPLTPILGLYGVFEHDNYTIVKEVTMDFIGYNSFELNGIYQITLSYSVETDMYEINVYKYDRYGKQNVYHNIKDNDDNDSSITKTNYTFDSRPNLSNHTIKSLILYGGCYYIGHPKLSINNNTIIDDNCRPIMVLNPHQN
jgi:hypothetical protein